MMYLSLVSGASPAWGYIQNGGNISKFPFFAGTLWSSVIKFVSPPRDTSFKYHKKARHLLLLSRQSTSICGPNCSFFEIRYHFKRNVSNEALSGRYPSTLSIYFWQWTWQLSTNFCLIGSHLARSSIRNSVHFEPGLPIYVSPNFCPPGPVCNLRSLLNCLIILSQNCSSSAFS